MSQVTLRYKEQVLIRCRYKVPNNKEILGTSNMKLQIKVTAQQRKPWEK